MIYQADDGKRKLVNFLSLTRAILNFCVLVLSISDFLNLCLHLQWGYSEPCRKSKTDHFTKVTNAL